MIVYFDTSAIVPLVIDEPSSTVASRLWDEADRVVSSRLVYAEGRAALAMARRLDRIDESGLREAVDDFESLNDQLDVIEVTERLIREAGGLAEQLCLRGYDAVHLASARLVDDAEMVLAAGDQSLLVAARAIGLATADLTRQS
ncbi:type II toxin-antitoxin system VapC family toxin [Acidiferrimicrobium sp. IK]|nr:type II toxin-antitoxin system VapC family toxin [Acidiferrimicrobium sp. IK]